MVGRVGVEPTTSRLSGVRSNHLSYRPHCTLLAPNLMTRRVAAGGESQLRLSTQPKIAFARCVDLQDEGT